jgi:hypothetical protein
MRRISIALALVLVAGAALSLGGVAAGSSRASSGLHAVMSVSGKASKGATVIWGTFRSGTRNGKFPFHKTVPVFDDQYSYFVTGTLKHKSKGTLTCKLTIGALTKTGHTKRGRNYCTARLTSDNKGGWK